MCILTSIIVSMTTLQVVYVITEDVVFTLNSEKKGGISQICCSSKKFKYLQRFVKRTSIYSRNGKGRNMKNHILLKNMCGTISLFLFTNHWIAQVCKRQVIHVKKAVNACLDINRFFMRIIHMLSDVLFSALYNLHLRG